MPGQHLFLETGSHFPYLCNNKCAGKLCRIRKRANTGCDNIQIILKNIDKSHFCRLIRHIWVSSISVFGVSQFIPAFRICGFRIFPQSCTLYIIFMKQSYYSAGLLRIFEVENFARSTRRWYRKGDETMSVGFYAYDQL